MHTKCTSNVRSGLRGCIHAPSLASALVLLDARVRRGAVELQVEGADDLLARCDQTRLEQVLVEQRKRPGIVDIRVAIVEDRDLVVGDDVMVLVVAGDIRENVIAVLSDTLNLIKATVTEKTEYFL